MYGILGGTSGKEPACQCRRHKRHRFDLWIGKIPWRRAWQPTPVFLPGVFLYLPPVFLPPWTEKPGKLQSVQFSSVAQLWLTLCDPLDCSMPSLPVYHQLRQFTQTHVHWVDDAIQPSHPLSSSSPPTFNLSKHQGLFKWVSVSYLVAKSIGVSASALVLPVNIQNWFHEGLVWSPCCPRKSQESPPRPQFKSINSSVLRFLYNPTLTSIYDY